MREVTFREIAEDTEQKLAEVPYSDNCAGPLEDEERATFLTFGDEKVEADYEAFPLQVYLGNGSSLLLVVHPKKGVVNMEGNCLFVVGNRKIVICERPFGL